MSSFLDSLTISDEATNGPYFGILYGPAGVGKTWLCKYAPKPFYIAVEKGVEKVPGVGKFLENGNVRLPKTIDEFFSMMRYFITNQHDYKTVVIDSGKFLDLLMISDIIKNNPVETKNKRDVPVEAIGDYNYGTGYCKLLALYDKFLKGVSTLNEKGINVILIAHSFEKNATTTTGAEYKKASIDMSEFGRQSVPSILYARSDWTYYIRSEVFTKTEKNKFGAERTIAIDGLVPEVVVYTRASNSFDAKVRTSEISNIPNSYIIDIEDPSTSKQIFVDLEK